jgi:hypothetical protein
MAPAGASIVERADVAAGGERPPASGRQNHPRHRHIGLPLPQLLRQRPDHTERHRIQRLRPVERDNPCRAAALE